MENKIYPDGTKKETEEFSKRQEISDSVFNTIIEVLEGTTEDAFKKVGYTSVDTEKYISGKDTKIAKGIEDGKYNISLSWPKGAKRPSIITKTIIVDGKRLICQISLEIKGETLSVTYKNTEAAAFSLKELNKKFTISNISKKETLKKELKSNLKDLSESEVDYILNTKIAVSDKVEKNMDDSIIKENKLMTISELMSESLENAGEKIFNNFLSESKKEKEKDLLLGDNEEGDKKFKTVAERDKELDEISTGGSAGVAAIGGQPIDGTIGTVGNFKYAANAFEKTPYFQAKQPKAYVKRTIKEGNEWTDVELVNGSGYIPKGMEHNYVSGKHSENVKECDEPTIEESRYISYLNKKVSDKEQNYGYIIFKNSRDVFNEGFERFSENKLKESLVKRKFTIAEEVEKNGMNKRYIAEEKLSKEHLSDRWSQLVSHIKNETIEPKNGLYESKKTIVKTEEPKYEVKNLYEGLSKTHTVSAPVKLINEMEVVDVPKCKNSNAMLRIFKEHYENTNRAFVFDHFSGMIVNNPNFKID